jgi:hypothetical protein
VLARRGLEKIAGQAAKSTKFLFHLKKPTADGTNFYFQ